MISTAPTDTEQATPSIATRFTDSTPTFPAHRVPFGMTSPISFRIRLSLLRTPEVTTQST